MFTVHCPRCGGVEVGVLFNGRLECDECDLIFDIVIYDAPDSPYDGYVGVKEAARILGWSTKKLAVYAGRGKLPSPITRLASGPVWRRQDIEAYRDTLK